VGATGCDGDHVVEGFYGFTMAPRNLSSWRLPLLRLLLYDPQCCAAGPPGRDGPAIELPGG